MVAEGSSVRSRILDALVDITAESGLERVSIREVASHAGVSIGAVQYHGRTKHELLRLALHHALDNSRRRMEALPRDGRMLDLMRVAAREFMAIDARRSKDANVYLAFAARAMVTPELSAVLHEALAQLRALCADAYRFAIERGQVDEPVDPEQFAIVTVALIDGLNLQLLADPEGLDADEAVRLVDDHLTRHFGDSG